MNHAILFVKEPVPGRVKTRLSPPLSSAQAAGLYSAFARDTLAALERVAGARVEVAYDARPSAEPAAWLGASAGRWFPQHGEDLGARMHAAFERAFAQGARRAVIVGSDLPDLEPRAVSRAFELLAANDVVLGPSEDGGYYLVGLTRPRPELFAGMAWSQPDVLERTLLRAGRLGLSHGLLEARRDVDTADDLEALRARLRAAAGGAAHTRRALLELEPAGKGDSR